ncbi:phosphoribulokinase [Synechococcus sp. M16CYN]
MLLNYLGFGDAYQWRQSWMVEQVHLALDAWHPKCSVDWLWSLGLPILSYARTHSATKQLIGLSALPGCGKSTFGRWLETAARNLGLSVQVVSIDDFYFAAEQLEEAMQGNPWRVPRALPGSHELDLLMTTLEAWRNGELVLLPRFDKALRNARGDRCGWQRCKADLLLLEGWFVGCKNGFDPLVQELHLNPQPTEEELRYRERIQHLLLGYQPIWSQFDQLWQLRAVDFLSPQLWKRQQESLMQSQYGISLNSAEVDSFVRMILTAIPSRCFENIPADVVLEVNANRQLTRIHVNNSRQDSLPSGSSTG